MPEPYTLEFSKQARETLKKIPAKDAKQIIGKLMRLAANIHEIPHEAMQGNWQGYYRIRIGDYRAIYAIHHEQRLIAVVKIGHRREVYDE